MLLLIASITCPEDRELMTDFYNSKLKLLYHEAQKYISGKEDIEDVVYEAFARIIEKIDVFKTLQPKQQDKYAIVTVRNLCFLHLRSEKHFSILSFEEALKAADMRSENNPDLVLEQQLYNEQLHCIIAQLETPERLLLEQKYILKWSDVEMAQLYGIKTQSIRMRLTRAKRKLLKAIQAQNFQMPIGPE